MLIRFQESRKLSPNNFGFNMIEKGCGHLVQEALKSALSEE